LHVPSGFLAASRQFGKLREGNSSNEMLAVAVPVQCNWL
jgi:hypothetical protein